MDLPYKVSSFMNDHILGSSSGLPAGLSIYLNLQVKVKVKV
jgi:hypothetical protein